MRPSASSHRCDQPRALEALVWRAAKPVAQIQYLN
jgi:hypothetical protein